MKLDKKKLKKQMNEQTITLTSKEVNQIKLDATQKAIDITRLFPLLVLRDEFGFGSKRAERFLKKYDDMMDAYAKGYIKLDDVKQTIEDELKIDLKGRHD